MTKPTQILLFASLLLARRMPAQQLTFTILDYPNLGGALAYGINDSGTVVGSYGNPYNGSKLHGFIFANGMYQTLDHAGDNTELLSINNGGQILAHDLDSDQYFIYSGGQFNLVGTGVDVLAGSPTCGASNAALGSLLFVNGLNNNGQIAGAASSSCGSTFLFGVFGTPSLGPPGSTAHVTANGTYTQLTCPAVSTRATALNDAGGVAGFCGTSAFVYTGGTPNLLTYPGQSAGAAFGINNTGQVVGQYQTAATGTTLFGVLFGSSPLQILPPGATSSVARAINNSGQIAGWFIDPNGGTHGFVTGGNPVTTTPIQITTQSLPTAAVGMVYDSGQLTATGGSGSYTWTLSSGTLPTDFTLLPTGKIVAPSTTQATPGTYQLRIRATDINGIEYAEKNFPLIVLPMITIVDPVPQLLNGPQITTATVTLGDMSKGRAVQGLATDGVAQVVMRILATSVGEQFAITLPANQCSGLSNADCIDEYGLLFDPTNPPANIFSSQSGQSFLVAAVSTATGPMAFAAYRAPVDFVRPDQSAADSVAAQRQVTINVASQQSGQQQSVQLTLVRAPLMFVHGFNTDSSSWNTFVPLINKTTQYAISRIDYGAALYGEMCLLNQCTYQPLRIVYGNVLSINSTSPPIPPLNFYSHVLQSHLGFSFNSPYVSSKILQVIADFDLGANPVGIPVAGVRGDVVAHSMGGLVTRYWTTYPSYLSRANYNQGYLHKMITLGTPHFGTPQAILSVLPQSVCSRDLAAIVGSLFFSTATLTNNAQIPGAAAELSGDGIGNSLSVALTRLEVSTSALESDGIHIPLATIAGDISSIQNEIDSSIVSGFTAVWCSNTGDPLAARYRSLLFASIFDPTITAANPWGTGEDRKSDGSVPLTSAMMNAGITDSALCAPGLCFLGYTHSSGIQQFFSSSANYLQDSSGPVESEVELLLNTSIRSRVF